MILGACVYASGLQHFPLRALLAGHAMVPGNLWSIFLMLRLDAPVIDMITDRFRAWNWACISIRLIIVQSALVTTVFLDDDLLSPSRCRSSSCPDL